MGFSLERDGVLVSWALPKGLPVDPKSNHLAVFTPRTIRLDYGAFAGDIPKGEYGGGHVDIWDHGTYELEKWTDREVMVTLHGTRAERSLRLVPDKEGQELDDSSDGRSPRGFEPMPETIKPMLAQVGELPKSDENWAYEFKWDGFRAIVFVEGGRVRALSRNHKDLTESFPELREIGLFLGSRALPSWTARSLRSMRTGDRTLACSSTGCTLGLPLSSHVTPRTSRQVFSPSICSTLEGIRFNLACTTTVASS